MIFIPESIFAKRRELLAQMADGKLDAEEGFQRALDLDPSDALALTALSQKRRQAGDLAAAAEFAWRAVEADPTMWECWRDLYLCLSESGENASSLNGILELAERKKKFRDDEALDGFEHAGGQTDDEPLEVTERLKPHRLIQDLLEQAEAGLDRELVDAIVQDGKRCAPLLIGVIRATLTNPFWDEGFPAAAPSVAILGQIGDPAVLRELLEVCEMDDDAIEEAAGWAVRQIARRQPKETLEVLKEAAEEGGEERNAVAFYLGRLPEQPGQLEVVLGMLDRLERLPKPERTGFFMSVAEAIFDMRGFPGLEMSEALLRRHAALLPKRARTEFRSFVELCRTLGPRSEGADSEFAGLTVYEFCEGAEYDDSDDEFPDEHDEDDGEGDFEDAEDFEDLGPAPVRRPPAPGRNDPCWCGSGKKYKKCHLEADERERQAPAHEEPLPAVLEDSPEAKLRRRLIDFAYQTLRKRDMERALLTFAGPEELENGTEDDFMMQFNDWLIHDYVMPRTGSGFIEEFTKRSPGGLTRVERRMLQDWRQSRYSLYEVQEVREDSGVVFKDLLAGGEAFVRDVSASKVSARWDCYLARVEESDGAKQLTVVMLSIPREVINELQEWAMAGQLQSQLSWDAFLRANSHQLRRKALELVKPFFGPARVLSPEDDEIVFSRAVYDIVDEDQLRRSLDGFAGFHWDENSGGYAWLDEAESENGGRRVYGFLRITQGRLTLECMTRQRLERGAELLRKLAGDSLRHKGDEFEGLGPALRDRDQASHAVAKSPVQSEAERDLLRKVTSEHYVKWLDRPLPALDMKTPREAVADPQDRPRLVEVLKLMENREEHKRREGGFWYDVAQLRAELGIEA